MGKPVAAEENPGTDNSRKECSRQYRSEEIVQASGNESAAAASDTGAVKAAQTDQIAQEGEDQ